jgi:hypothetical protein
MKNLEQGSQGSDEKINQRGSVAPYLLGWLLGVPGSILFVIFILRGCR